MMEMTPSWVVAKLSARQHIDAKTAGKIHMDILTFESIPLMVGVISF